MAVPDTDYHREVSEKIAGFVQELLKAQNVETEELSVPYRRARKPSGDTGCAWSLCDRQSVCDKAYCQGVREICDGNAACESGQHTGSGCDGDTGMETVEVVRGAVKTKPDLVIAVDALGYSWTHGRTIQSLSRTGIIWVPEWEINNGCQENPSEFR